MQSTNTSSYRSLSISQKIERIIELRNKLDVIRKKQVAKEDLNKIGFKPWVETLDIYFHLINPTILYKNIIDNLDTMSVENLKRVRKFHVNTLTNCAKKIESLIKNQGMLHKTLKDLIKNHFDSLIDELDFANCEVVKSNLRTQILQFQQEEVSLKIPEDYKNLPLTDLDKQNFKTHATSILQTQFNILKSIEVVVYYDNSLKSRFKNDSSHGVNFSQVMAEITETIKQELKPKDIELLNNYIDELIPYADETEQGILKSYKVSSKVTKKSQKVQTERTPPAAKNTTNWKSYVCMAGTGLIVCYVLFVNRSNIKDVIAASVKYASSKAYGLAK